MRYADLGSSGLKTSVLGFGCAAMMGRAGRKKSLRALTAAYDAGITFFDTARSYGYGESEGLLGEFLGGERQRVILSTKFGIVPARQQLWKRAMKPMVRSFLSVAPSARSLIRKQVAAQFQAQQLTAEVLKKSLDESLRKLRTSYVDILFMHSAPASVLAQCDLLEALERLVSAGKIRVAGISADPDVIAAVLDSRPRALRAMQFPVNSFDSALMRRVASAGHTGLIFIANHPFGGSQGLSEMCARLGELAASPSISGELRNKLKPIDENVVSEVVLNLALRDTGIQVVVPSMMELNHLHANIHAISSCRFTTAELALIRYRTTDHFHSLPRGQNLTAEPKTNAN